MKLKDSMKWAIAAAVTVATVAATVSIANAYTITADANSSGSANEINIISNSGGHFELAENDAIKQARSFTLNVEIDDYWEGYRPAHAKLEYGRYDSNGEVKLGEFVKDEVFTGDLTVNLSEGALANGEFWLRLPENDYSSVTFHSISFFDVNNRCILYGSADKEVNNYKWTFYQLESPTISVVGIDNSDGSYFEDAEVSVTEAAYPLVIFDYNGSNHDACTWGGNISNVFVKGGETLDGNDNIAFDENGNNEYEYSAYSEVTLTDTMNNDSSVTLYSLPVENTVTLTDKYVVSYPDGPVVVDDSALKEEPFNQRTKEGIVSFANAWSGSPVLSGGINLVTDTRPNCRIAEIVDKDEVGNEVQTYFVDVTYTDVDDYDPDVRAEQTVTLVGEADVSKLSVPNGYDNTVTVPDVKVASDYLTGVTLTAPTKTSYTFGETLDLTGGKLTLSYERSADAEIPLTDSKVSVTGISTLGSQTITVTYQAAPGEAKEDAVLIGTFEVTVNPEKVADPVIQPAGGTFNAPVEVTITCATSSAKIFYTTDGSEPTANSTLYEGAFTVSETTTVKAIAVKENFTDSSVVSASYTMVVSDPVISPNGGAFSSSQKVTITCATEGASIYYTTDGSAPTANSTLYEGAFTVSETTTVKAIAVKENWTDSSVVSASYTKLSYDGPSGGSSGGRINRPTTSTQTYPSIDRVQMPWSDIEIYLNKLAIGSEVTIELNGNTTVPAAVIKVIAELDLKATFVFDSVKSWKTDGAEITNTAEADLSIFSASNLDTGSLRGITGIKFSITDNSIPTDLMIAFKKEHAGKFANLYKDVDGKLVFVTCAKLGTDGKVILPDVNGKGDYVAMLCEFSDRLGDMNNDGILNTTDASAILKDIVGLESGKNPLLADFNGDGKVMVDDASSILKRIVGLA